MTTSNHTITSLTASGGISAWSLCARALGSHIGGSLMKRREGYNPENNSESEALLTQFILIPDTNSDIRINQEGGSRSA